MTLYKIEDPVKKIILKGYWISSSVYLVYSGIRFNTSVVGKGEWEV